ncbi:hypothetical protein HanIR_Chr02g0068721 [Helianthus annuus]|nr:hypothetical protein HanIR_Chr02g0068721 [Helianthus annuus]
MMLTVSADLDLDFGFDYDLDLESYVEQKLKHTQQQKTKQETPRSKLTASS